MPEAEIALWFNPSMPAASLLQRTLTTHSRLIVFSFFVTFFSYNSLYVFANSLLLCFDEMFGRQIKKIDKVRPNQ